MKYIITEDKLYDAIYKMIDDFMLESEIQWELGLNPYNHKYTEHEVRFIGNDYIDGIDGEPLFTYVKEEWFEEIERDPDMILKYQDKTPLLEINSDTRFRNQMNGFFSDAWRPVFEEWWRNSFIAFPVKTFYFF